MRYFIALSATTVLLGCSEYEYYTQDAADVFYQLEASEVDILLVVDNSCSMEPYQTKLANNFDNFLTFFVEGDVDYQIGVTTTSVGESEPYGSCTQQDIDAIPAVGDLVGNTIITPETANGSDVFSDIVNVGVCGYGYEMGLESGYQVLNHAFLGLNTHGLIRDEAFLSLIFVSDEEDASPWPVNDYINAMRSIKGQDGERAALNASALVVNSTDDCNQNQINSGATPGNRYLDVAEQMDGIIGNICGDDFESIVTELSLTSSRLTDTFNLSLLPAVGSIVVAITDSSGDDYEVGCDTGEWAYELVGEGNEIYGTIVFDRAFLPPPNSKITVSYDLGNGDPVDFCGGTGEAGGSDDSGGAE